MEVNYGHHCYRRSPGGLPGLPLQGWHPGCQGADLAEEEAQRRWYVDPEGSLHPEPAPLLHGRQQDRPQPVQLGLHDPPVRHLSAGPQGPVEPPCQRCHRTAGIKKLPGADPFGVGSFLYFSTIDNTILFSLNSSFINFSALSFVTCLYSSKYSKLFIPLK